MCCKNQTQELLSDGRGQKNGPGEKLRRNLEWFMPFVPFYGLANIICVAKIRLGY
jgi:hypothetical protein